MNEYRDLWIEVINSAINCLQWLTLPVKARSNSNTVLDGIRAYEWLTGANPTYLGHVRYVCHLAAVNHEKISDPIEKKWRAEYEAAKVRYEQHWRAA